MSITAAFLVARVLLAAFAVVGPRAAGFSQDRFVISFWVDPVVPEAAFALEYTRIASANFTALMGGFGASDPASVRLQVAACNAAGLACLPCSCETAARPGPAGSCVGASDGPVFGYQMVDEPQRSDFPALAAWAASVAVRAPGALRFINLLPNYFLPAPSSPAYDDYVAAFVTTVKPDILCFDHYPEFFVGSETDTSDVSQAGYIRNLQIIRRAVLGANISFWNFFGAMPYGGRSDVSESHMRWQIYTSLAHGAKGLLYFCYWSPAGTTFQWGQALMTPHALSGNELVTVAEGAQDEARNSITAHGALKRQLSLLGGGAPSAYVQGLKFAQAQRINSKLRIYGENLLRATSTFVFAANGPAPLTLQLQAAVYHRQLFLSAAAVRARHGACCSALSLAEASLARASSSPTRTRTSR